MSQTRIERDSMGEMAVPADALYGASTARAIENFPISGWPMPTEFIHALGAIKLACAQVNRKAKRLDKDIADAIIKAAMEVVAGRLDDHFPVDVFQTGSGTSTNTNANEVIANRAMQLLAGRGIKKKVHPNDHVNMGQSSNDVIPSAIHISAVKAIEGDLMLALSRLRDSLGAKAREFDDIVKIGRTHLMDAVPVRLGQELAGYAQQVDHSIRRAFDAMCELTELAIGGTAVGTGLNAPGKFGRDVCKKLSMPGIDWGQLQKTAADDALFRDFQVNFPLYIHDEAEDHFAAQGAKDAVLFASGVLKTIAIALSKIASDIRLLGSGPRCGFGELVLPATQPGSSIMPGKVNPVICESVIQVACQVVGCDAAITMAAAGGVGSILELNVAMPVIASNLLTSIKLLAAAARVFDEKCIRGLQANRERCEELVEQSLAMVTVLAPRIGYDAAAELAKEAHRTGKTIRQLCLAKKVLSKKELNSLLDARNQTGK